MRQARMLLPLAAAVCLCAQQSGAPAASFDIKGTVVEAGTSLGVEGVKVVLEESGFDLRDPLKLETTTGVSGSFRVHVDRAAMFSVGVSKDGYISTGKDIDLTGDKPQTEVTIGIRRRPEITGRLEDWDTGEPVRGASVAAALMLDAPVPVPLGLTGRVSTDADGGFRISPPQPGRLAVRIRAAILDQPHLTDFQESDVDVVDQDFEESYWPGGGTLASVLPMEAASGAHVDVGTIRVRKVPYYRALVTLPDQGCASEEAFAVRVFNSSGNRQDQIRKVPCGQDLLLRGLLPGRYRLEVTPEIEDVAKGRWAFVPFEVVDETVRLAVDLRPGVDLEGRVVAAEGAGELPPGVQVKLIHRGLASDKESRVAEVDEKGRFRFPNVGLDRWYVSVTQVKAPFYLSKVRFRGAPLPMETGRLPYQDFCGGAAAFDWDGGGALELELDDRPATVNVSVTEDDEPVAGALTILARWPPPAGGYGGMVATGPVDAGGHAQFHSLPPGEYRVIAVPYESGLALQYGVDLVERLVALGEPVRVTRGASLDVKATLIRRAP